MLEVILWEVVQNFALPSSIHPPPFADAPGHHCLDAACCSTFFQADHTAWTAAKYRCKTRFSHVWEATLLENLEALPIRSSATLQENGWGIYWASTIFNNQFHLNQDVLEIVQLGFEVWIQTAVADSRRPYWPSLSMTSESTSQNQQHGLQGFFPV